MTHKDLDVWKRSMDLVLKIYELTEMLPSGEKFGLISQIKSASVSVPSNLQKEQGVLQRKNLSDLSISLMVP